MMDHGLGQNRLVPLEAVRGLAALSVVAYHGLMAFLPRHSGYLASPGDPASLALSPFYGPLNGSAAVTVFFVLSGHVVALGALRSASQSGALRSALRRYPRLAGPVMASCLLSWSLFACGAYRFGAAAEASGSTWLATFGEAEPFPFDRGLGEALRQGAWGALVQGHTTFNPALWTMRPELLGSLAVICAAGASMSGAALPRVLLALAGAIAAAFCEIGALVAFVAGGLSAAVPAGAFPRLRGWSACALAAAALYLLAYNDARPVPAFVGDAFGLDPGMSKTLAHVVAGCLMVAAARCPGPLARALDGRASAILGGASFPLYLVHVPVSFSLGSACFLSLYPHVGQVAAGTLATLLTATVSLAVSVAVAPADRAWVRLVRRVTGTPSRRGPGL